MRTEVRFPFRPCDENGCVHCAVGEDTGIRAEVGRQVFSVHTSQMILDSHDEMHMPPPLSVVSEWRQREGAARTLECFPV